MITKLTKDQREAIKAGNRNLLREVLEAERLAIIDMLIASPPDKTQVWQGKAQAYTEITDLLP